MSEKHEMKWILFSFLAYFQYAYVRALSGVRLSVLATTFHGVGRSCSFMARSIAYDPRTSVTEGFFLGPVLAPRGRAWSPFSLVFHTFSVAYREKGGKNRKKPEKNGKTGKTRKKTEKPEKTGKTEKTEKRKKRREKGSQNIKACILKIRSS